MHIITRFIMAIAVVIALVPTLSIHAMEDAMESRVAEMGYEEREEMDDLEHQIMMQCQCAAQLLVDAGLLDPAKYDYVTNDDRRMIPITDVHALVGPEGMTPLWAAACLGETAIAVELMRRKADVNVNSKDVTSLMCASAKGFDSVVEVLLEAKAVVEIANNEGHSAFMAASEMGHIQTVQKLLAAKAVVDQRDITGITSLMFAANGGHNAVVHLLLENKAAIDARTVHTGATPLLAAVEGNHISTAQLLIEKKADLFQKNNDGFMPVMAAASLRYEEMFNCLCDAMIKAGRDEELQEFFKKPPQ